MKPSIEDLRREAERCTGGGTAIIIHAIIDRLEAMEGTEDQAASNARIIKAEADEMIAKLTRERDEARAKLERPDRSLYTDRLRKACELAKQEATNMGHKYIGTEHMLLGLMREGSGVAANVLKNMGVDPVRVAADTLDLVGGTKVAEQAKPADDWRGKCKVFRPDASWSVHSPTDAYWLAVYDGIPVWEKYGSGLTRNRGTLPSEADARAALAAAPPPPDWSEPCSTRSSEGSSQSESGNGITDGGPAYAGVVSGATARLSTSSTAAAGDEKAAEKYAEDNTDAAPIHTTASDRICMRHNAFLAGCRHARGSK